jgi:hypothetical protein
VLMTFVGSVHNPKIMLGMLVKVLCGDAIAARRRLPRERNVTFEDLMRVASDFDVRTVTFQGLISVWHLLPIRVGIVTVIATIRSSGLSWSHDTCCIDGEVGSLSSKIRAYRDALVAASHCVGKDPPPEHNRRQRPCLIGVAIPRPQPLRRRRAAFLARVCRCRAGSPARRVRPCPFFGS